MTGASLVLPVNEFVSFFVPQLALSARSRPENEKSPGAWPGESLRTQRVLAEGPVQGKG